MRLFLVLHNVWLRLVIVTPSDQRLQSNTVHIAHEMVGQLLQTSKQISQKMLWLGAIFTVAIRCVVIID